MRWALNGRVQNREGNREKGRGVMGEKMEFEVKVLPSGLRPLMYASAWAVIPVPEGTTVGQRYRVTLEPVEPELKPCPLCGGDAEVQTNPKGTHYWVGCHGCGARGPISDWKGARQAWNLRREATQS